MNRLEQPTRGQADAIGMSYSRMQGVRSEKDLRYIPRREEIDAVKEAFRDVLKGFGEPTGLEKELIRYKELYQQALAAGQDKDRAILDLTAALAEITAQIKRNKGEEE